MEEELVYKKAKCLNQIQTSSNVIRFLEDYLDVLPFIKKEPYRYKGDKIEYTAKDGCKRLFNTKVLVGSIFSDDLQRYYEDFLIFIVDIVLNIRYATNFVDLVILNIYQHELPKMTLINDVNHKKSKEISEAILLHYDPYGKLTKYNVLDTFRKYNIPMSDAAMKYLVDYDTAQKNKQAADIFTLIGIAECYGIKA